MNRSDAFSVPPERIAPDWIAAWQAAGSDAGDESDLLRSTPQPPAQPQALFAEFVDRLGRAAAEDPDGLPGAGGTLFGFRLRKEIGRGSFARVFLAEQGALAGRPVVLKVTRAVGSEPQCLAQLQHSNIVPLYSAHEAGSLRALCMPYFGEATLSRVLRQLANRGKLPERGTDLLEALDRVNGVPGGPSDAAGPPARRWLAQASYVQAAAHLVAQLARALAHAHERGILHRDIKPSNILLGADGVPLLLDFNLSQLTRERGSGDSLGGTVVYMAPEHLRALARAKATPSSVDHRCDIYSLGLVLFEMLTGSNPFFSFLGSASPSPRVLETLAQQKLHNVPSLRQANPRLPWSLASIVGKCVAADPDERYQDARHLAEDLRAFLADQPLRHAPEPSRCERLAKWARRHPRLTSGGTIAALSIAMFVGLAGTFAGVRTHLTALTDQDRLRQLEASRDEALCLVTTTSARPDHLQGGVDRCRAGLALYAADERDDWRERGEFRRLSEAEQKRASNSVVELLLLLAWARTRLSGDAPALREATALVDRAAAVEGNSPAVWRQRAALLSLRGDTAGATESQRRAATLAPTGARDHFLAACQLLLHRDRRGDTDDSRKALEALDEAIRLDPRHFGSWFLRGVCRQERNQPALAAADFSACIGLWPGFAPAYFNRGCALAAAHKYRAAIADYDEALRRDPALDEAYWNRALAYQIVDEHALALDDLREAARRGRDDAYLHAQRGLVLERLGRCDEADDAFRMAFARAGATTTDIHWWYGMAVHRRLPQEAEKAFAAVLAKHPHHPEALYGRAMLLAERGEAEAAVAAFDRALESNPAFMDARRFRAVLRARLGDGAAARDDINWCLSQEPTDGATLYAAACVSALGAENVEEALSFLRQAVAHGYGKSKALEDRDLVSLRKDATTRQAVEQILAAR